MTKSRWKIVESFIDGNLLRPDAVLAATLEDISASGLPLISVSPSQGKLLFVMARAMRARRILELGTLGGYSGIWLGRALPPDGLLVTIEVDPRYAEVARRNFARAGLTSRVDLRVGRALDLLPQVAADGLGPFDLVFIDADKTHYSEYLDWAIRLCRPGSLIVADNVVREGAVVDAASGDASVQGIRRFLAALGSERRVTGTGIQTVGTKGYDGFATLLVIEP